MLYVFDLKRLACSKTARKANGCEIDKECLITRQSGSVLVESVSVL